MHRIALAVSFAATTIFAACAPAALEPRATFRVRIVGTRSALDSADLVLSPAPDTGGPVVSVAGTLSRTFEYQWSVESLLSGRIVTLWSRRDGAVVDTQVLVPYVCAQYGAIDRADANDQILERQDVEVGEDGSLFVDTDLGRALHYACEVSSRDGADGEGVGAFEASLPLCAAADRAGTAVRFVEEDGTSVDAELCRAFDIIRDTEVLYVEFSGVVSGGRSLGISSSVCATPSDVPLVRTVAEVSSATCSREGILANVWDNATVAYVSLEPVSGEVRYDAIDDSRDGHLRGSIALVLRSELGETFHVQGPFVLPTLRIDARGLVGAP